jgi:hypothetical protein
MPRPRSPAGRWEDRHQVLHFYASDELREWIEAEMRATGKTKTQVIVEALEELRSKRPHRRKQ